MKTLLKDDYPAIEMVGKLGLALLVAVLLLGRVSLCLHFVHRLQSLNMSM